MNIIEEAQQVLAEISAALAMAEEATQRPWTFHEGTNNGWEVRGPWDNPVAVEPWHGGPEHVQHKELFRSTGRFIAASRTLLPKSLEIIRDDIKAWLEIIAEGAGNSVWAAPKGAQQAERRLADIIAQWKEAQP